MTSGLDSWCSDRFAITTNKLKDTWVWFWHQSSIVYSNLINPKSFDKHGNYSIGLEEQLMFPEIEYDKIDQVRGMDISIVTTANKQEEGLALLKEFGLPFKK